MSKVQFAYLKTYNRIIALLLTFLGVTVSCAKAEYGTPSANFIVNGNIKSSVTNQPIQNVRVVMENDSTYTDATGHYQVGESRFPVSQTFTIKIKDLDGSLNGEFNNFDTLVEFKDPQFINGDGHWYDGETTKVLNIKLTPKK